MLSDADPAAGDADDFADDHADDADANDADANDADDADEDHNAHCSSSSWFCVPSHALPNHCPIHVPDNNHDDDDHIDYDDEY